MFMEECEYVCVCVRVRVCVFVCVKDIYTDQWSVSKKKTDVRK